MRVKRRDEHTVTDDRCISLFSFPSPRRPAVRRGNEVRPPACHLGSWNEGRGRRGGRGIEGGGLDGSDEGGRAHRRLHPPSRILHDNERTAILPLCLSSSVLRLCIYVRVDVAPRTRAHRGRDKWLLRSFAAFSLCGEEYRHPPSGDGKFSSSSLDARFFKVRRISSLQREQFSPRHVCAIYFSGTNKKYFSLFLIKDNFLRSFANYLLVTKYFSYILLHELRKLKIKYFS